MTRSKVKVTSPSKLEIWPFSKAILSIIYNGSWQITTDFGTKVHYLNLLGQMYDIWPSFTSHDFELGRNVSCKQRVDCQSRTGLIYLLYLFCR